MSHLPPDGPHDGTILFGGGRIVMLQHISHYFASGHAVHRFQLILYLLGSFILLDIPILWQVLAEHKVTVEQLLYELPLITVRVVANLYPAHILISLEVS